MSTNWKSLDTVLIGEVETDPSVAPGVAAPVGSFASLEDGTALWLKYGSADTAWTPVISTEMFGGVSFGDGTDGDVTVNSSIAISRNMYYNNLTIENGGAINTAGYIVYVKGTLTIENGGRIGSTGANGGNGGNGTVGAGGAAGAAGTGTNTNVYLNRSAGGAGGAGGGIAPNAGAAGTASANGNNLVDKAPGNGSNGGAGGASGGSGSSAAGVAYRPIRTRVMHSFDGLQHFCSRGGNGGGGGGGSLAGGGGGGGGGGASAYPVKIHAKNIVIESGGDIHSIGGNGGNGGNGFGNGGGGGGGGGAAGGFVYIECCTYLNDGTIDVSGGTEGNPGNGAGTGSNGNTNGTNGADGDYIIFIHNYGTVTTVVS